jgi:hypothetical protein
VNHGQGPTQASEIGSGFEAAGLKARVRLARIHLERGHLSTAVAFCEAAPETPAKSSDWGIELGRVPLRAGDFEAALRRFSRVGAAGAGAALAKGIERARQGIERDAGLGVDPRLKRRFLLACEQMAREDYPAAEALLREVTQAAPRFAAAWLGLRGALEAQDRLQDAEALGPVLASLKAIPAGVAGAVMGRRLSSRGLLLDPRERYPVLARSEALGRARGPRELAGDADRSWTFDQGGETIRHPPALIPVGRPEAGIAPVQVTPKVFLLSLQNGAVVGRGAAVTSRGELIEGIMGQHDGPKFGAWFRDGAMVFDADLLMDGQCQVNVFDRPAIMMVGPTDTSWGDFVTNFAPRLRITEAAGLDADVLVNDEAPPQCLQLLEALGVGRERMLFHRTDQISIFPRLYVPSWPLRDRMRPMKGLFDVFRRLRPPQLPIQRPRLYISRQNVSNRPLANEAEVRALFEAAGFQVIQPERLSFEETRRLFAAPACVAGPYGSAFRNLVFSAGRPRCFTIMPPYPDAFLPGVALWLSLLELECTFVRGRPMPGDGGPNLAPWTVDLHEVERGLEALLA